MVELILLLGFLSLGLLGFPLMDRVDAFLEKIRSACTAEPPESGGAPGSSPHHHHVA